MKPTIGRILRYKGNRGFNAVRAAIVTADVSTLDPRGVASGAIPALDSDEHVHLWVFTPGENGGFTEYNVAPGDGPGQWSWPALGSGR